MVEREQPEFWRAAKNEKRLNKLKKDQTYDTKMVKVRTGLLAGGRVLLVVLGVCDPSTSNPDLQQGRL